MTSRPQTGVIKYVASFTTASFPPGTYTLRATLRSRESTHASETAFTIVP